MKAHFRWNNSVFVVAVPVGYLADITGLRVIEQGLASSAAIDDEGCRK